MGGGVPLILISILPTQWGGLLKILVFVLRSFLCECTSLFELCDCQSLPPSLSCPTMYSDLILYCTLLSYLVLCSFVFLLLPCLALSWSVVSFRICPIPSYPILSHPILPNPIPFHPIHSTPYPTLPYPALPYLIPSYPIPSYTAWLVLSRLSYPDEFSGQGLRPYHSSLGPLWPVLFLLVPSNTPNRLNWTELNAAWPTLTVNSPHL